MLNYRTGRQAVALALSLLSWAPFAGADDPPLCEETDPQCQEEQNPGLGIARRVIDEAKQGADRANRAVDLADKNCWVVNGVPTMWSPGMATGPGQRAEPCYYVYGLTPH